MFAAANNVWFRSRSWQSQRVTRRSLGALERAGRVFHPVPSHRGQTSTCVLVNINFVLILQEIVFSDFAPRPGLPASAKRRASVYNLCRGVRGCGRAEENRSWLEVWSPNEIACPFVYSFPARKPAPAAPIREQGVQNRLPARIFTVDILPRERKIRAVRFPTQPHAPIFPACAGY